MVVVFLSPHATLKANLLVQLHTYVKSASGVDSTWEGSRASSIFLVRLTFADVTWISFCFYVACPVVQLGAFSTFSSARRQMGSRWLP